jgi:PST family polysaccharide transporter/lipopolysaccharide exporter
MGAVTVVKREPAPLASQAAPPVVASDRFGDGPPMGLRSRTARGTIVNGSFMILVSALTLVQAVVIARLLSPSVLGLWGLLMAGFMTLLALGSVGIDDKYIQQDEPDQQRAFEIAFTIQVLLGVVFVVVILVGMPLFALIYGRPELIAPGCALALAIPALALQMPLWTHYRRMDFVRQRTLQFIDPVVTLVATVALLLAGLKVWGLVLGAIAGSTAATIAIVRSSPYPLRLRWERGAAKEYWRFSWPLFLTAIVGVLMAQAPIIVSARVLGVAAVAGIALAASIAGFTTRVDSLVTQTLYPAICAVKDRTDLLFESFWKSNRLALLWAAPLGIAAALFAGDFVHYVIGEKWRFAVPLIAAFGLSAVINQIGFNWTAFFRARGDTRPLAVAGIVGLVSVWGIAVPLLVTDGITGYGVGIGTVAVIGVALRLWYLRRIFPGLAIWHHIARGIAPTVPAAVAILAVRAVDPGARTALRVVAESLLYAAIAIAATYVSERPLLRESFDYLRGVRLGRAARPSGATG